MKIRILYFAFLRDAMGRSGEELDIPAQVRTAGELRGWLVDRGDPWSQAFARVKRIRASVNQVMARDETPIHEGDEVAFFPPVTGG